MTASIHSSETFSSSGGTIEAWQAPEVGRAAPPAQEAPREPAAAPALTVERLQQIETEAREAGYRRGVEEGRRDGLAERTRQTARLTALMASIAPQSGVLDDQLLDQLGSLVTTVARQILRRELRLQPGEVVRAVREAVAVLPASESRISLHLNPEDVELVREVLHPDLLERPWRIVEDVTMARGGARVETDVSSVDATVETRMNALLVRLLGDERGSRRDA